MVAAHAVEKPTVKAVWRMQVQSKSHVAGSMGVFLAIDFRVTRLMPTPLSSQIQDPRDLVWGVSVEPLIRSPLAHILKGYQGTSGPIPQAGPFDIQGLLCSGS